MITFTSPITGWNIGYFPTYGQGVVAPFWSDVRVRYSTYDRIWYRQATDTETLNRATEEVRGFGCSTFTAQWVFVATWYRVRYFGGGISGPVSLVAQLENQTKCMSGIMVLFFVLTALLHFANVSIVLIYLIDICNS